VNVVAGVLVGLFAGVASGLAGVGGGVVMIPAMTELMGLGQRVAQGTSLLAILFTSLSGTVVNLRNRRVSPADAAVIGVAGVVAAQAGLQMALRLDQEVLRRLFGALVLVTGGRMLWQVWRGREKGTVGGDGGA
jgi:hypothetical protein